ncbi:MAG: hypothetical protein ACXIUL_11880 [Wenzhouxiangella sp.]
MTLSAVDAWSPATSRRFEFVGRELDPASGRVALHYRLDGIDLTERFELPPGLEEARARQAASVDAALDLLHWLAGVSYWKAGCPAEIVFADRQPSRWQADALNRIWQGGLAEFAWHNQLDRRNWPRFHGVDEPPALAATVPLQSRSLVPMGGGKDSLVAWHRLARRNCPADSVQIGRSALIADVGQALAARHWVIGRQLDARLGALNAAGALNGHVPVTAINSAALVLTALLLDYDRVVFANERSAEEATRLDTHGQPINHQFSKSFEFEALFDDWVRRYVHPDLHVFSLLRRDRELAICREFAGLSEFHRRFSSCNRNFHLDGPRGQRWCGQCPKCHFVFLALAPFLSRSALVAIFGRDLLDDPEQWAGFLALLALDGSKPFECVGEADEARAAVRALAGQPQWTSACLVPRLNEALGDRPVPSLESLCRPGGPHRIPEELLDATG